ncbi:MAG: UDP-N-acetylmuramoyl-L-alanine--D-glutamate ligase [Verrucomicrobia bacterium]|nr:UDP-N-acetylmuramoyl-L-alanine--D-glutamate ligase [Verrucomicrobiota bacterium]
MKALVLGLGISGKSVVKFLEKRGYTVIGVDDKVAPQNFETLKDFDLFVPSPGIPRTHRLYKMAVEEKIPIAGDVQLALGECKQSCIGVTGSNGKTTTVKMIEHCLNACGKKARAVGNVGDPIADFLGGDEILVVELSSYQLETLTAKVFDVGIILNIFENHLDRYDSFGEYARAKVRLEHCIKSEGKFYVHRSVDPKLFASRIIEYSGENDEAAYLACAYFGIDRKSFDAALSSFVKPPHRIEFVAKIDGVSYYNDSKGTNTAAIIKALEVLNREVVLIAGGQDKGLNFDPLCAYKDQLSSVVVYGEAREKIATALKQMIDVHVVITLQEAVECARRLVKKEGTILFSPGCASFDAFKNYAERGEAFRQYVRSER